MVHEAQPHRGHAGRKRHALGLEQLVQRLAVQCRAGQHELCAGQQRGIRQAPCVHMEHRHDGQHHVGRAHVQDVRHGGCVGMQDSRPVRIQRPFRIARRARRVAQRCRRTFVEFGPGVVGGYRIQQVFVAQQIGDAACGRHVRAIRHQHERLHRRAARRDRLDQRQEGQVEEQQPVLRVVDDVRDLVRMQARIDRVQHGAGTGDGVIQLQVPVAVPGQRADTLPHRDALLAEHTGQPARPRFAVAHRVAVHVALHAARDDFAGTVVPGGEPDDARDHQRLVHHPAHEWGLHGSLHRCPRGC